MRKKTIALSGGFDPVHVGHIKMIESAARQGQVLIILNSDPWLRRKKGYVFMPWKERVQIMGNIKGVVAVTSVDDRDGTVCDALRKHQPDAFGNGGDRKTDNTPEMEVCEELGIELIWNLGGEKIQSSSDLVANSKLKQGNSDV